MLILPSRLHHQAKEACPSSASTVQTPQDPQPTFQPSDQDADTMLSVMPPVRPATAKRPKLSLQTSPSPATRPKVVLNTGFTTNSPTIRNTHVNAFQRPATQNSPYPRENEESSPQRRTTPSSAPPGSSPISSHTSPFPLATPYFLPLGARSILRNSPLPRRHVSAASARAPRKMFPPVKRVVFHEPLEETIPVPKLEETSESSDPDNRTEAEIKERRAIIEEEDGSATPLHGRRKRRREWVWRPLDDDILVEHHKDTSDVVLPNCLGRAGSSGGESQ